MKKYKSAFDIILLASLGLISLFAITSETLVMPDSLQMALLAVVLGLVASYIALLWREHPTDEREVYNQALASRLAYIVGVIILIGAIVIQSLQHAADPITTIALFAMITTKVIMQRKKDGS